MTMRRMIEAAYIAALAVLAGGSTVHGAESRVFDRTVPAPAKGVVDISNVAGAVQVSGWDRPEVAVHAELGAGVERVDVTNESGRTQVKVVLPQHSGHDGSAQLSVRVPKDSEVDVAAVSADVTTAGVLGVQRLNAVSGDITAELAGADAELKSVSGDVKLRGHGQPARLHVSTVSGDVHLEHGAGDLEAGTVSGEITASLDTARSVRARTTSGEVHFQGRLTRGATVDASTVSGDIDVRAGAEGGFGYEAKSFSGDITDCFGAAATHEGSGLPGHTLEGKRGEASATVRLKTMSGDINLCDHN